MGNCCVNHSQIINVHKMNFQQKRTSEGNYLMSSISFVSKSRRTSVYIYNNEDINKNYAFEKEIGKGYYGKVSIVIPKNDRNKKYACKSINKSKINDSKINNLLREIEILSLLDHPNIVKFYETYNDKESFHIIMELCTGGDILSHVSEDKSFNEEKGRRLIFTLLSAILHCHSLRIVHRDLKPDNILFESKAPFSDIKVIDFGLSKKYMSIDDLRSIVGSPYYVAPEVLDGAYDDRCDIWSIGVITYCIFYGVPPFFSNTREEVFNKIKNSPLIFGKEKIKISQQAKDFISRTLNKNPKHRPNAKELLNDKWFASELNKENDVKMLNSTIIQKINNYHRPNQLTKRVTEIIIKKLPNSSVEQFKELFNLLDKKKIGLISISDFESALSEMNIKVNKESIRKVSTKRYDKYLKEKFKDEMINFTSFIELIIDKKVIKNKDGLKEVFNFLDTDKTGLLTVSSVQKAFERTGKKTTYAEVKEMFREIGLDETESLNFDHFFQIITKDM